MTLYAVVENFSNHKCCESLDQYNNQVVGLYESEQDAMNHICDGIPEIFERNGDFNGVYFYKVKNPLRFSYGSTLSREIKKVDTNSLGETLSGAFIFGQNGMSVKFYL